MKKALLLILCGIVIFGMTGCNYSGKNNTDSALNTQEEKKVDVIYKDDEGINLFINKYNALYEPDITSDMLSKKHIGGSDRDNVVTVANNKLEINIYDNYGANGNYNMSVYVGYKTDVDANVDEYKQQFSNFIKLFDQSLSDEDINNYWNDMISSYHSSYDINDIDILTMTDNGNIDYFKLTKDLKL